MIRIPLKAKNEEVKLDVKGYFCIFQHREGLCGYQTYNTIHIYLWLNNNRVLSTLSLFS